MLTFLQTNEADLEYVRNRSLGLDMRILIKTLGVTLKGDGAL
jgi:lipopolysaccharide/colanic/teichoic acid biosynthesis glycosyltransferase